jgi:hypothetical protein
MAQNPMNPHDGIPDIAAMKEAKAQDFRRLAYENDDLRKKLKETGQELERVIVIKHKVIDFASFFEEGNETFIRNRPFPQIWKEFTDRVEDLRSAQGGYIAQYKHWFKEASRFEAQNRMLEDQVLTLERELESRRNRSSVYLDDRILR